MRCAIFLCFILATVAETLTDPMHTIETTLYVGYGATVRGACHNLEDAMSFFTKEKRAVNVNPVMRKPLDGGQPVVVGWLHTHDSMLEQVTVQLSHSIFMARLRSRLQLRVGAYVCLWCIRGLGRACISSHASVCNEHSNR